MPPAPLPVLPGVYYARVEATADLKQITNIFAWQKAGMVVNDPADAANAAQVAQIVAARWPIMQPELHVTYTGVQVAVYPLGSNLLPAATHALSMTGTSIGAIHYKQLAGRVKHTVSRRGRGSQHSSYLSPMSDNDITVNGDQVTPAWRASAASDFNAFLVNTLSDLNIAMPGTWTHVQVSKFQNKAYVGRAFPILSSVVQVELSSQRRRLGRG